MSRMVDLETVRLVCSPSWMMTCSGVVRLQAGVSQVMQWTWHSLTRSVSVGHTPQHCYGDGEPTTA